jgi:hypothetical protein
VSEVRAEEEEEERANRKGDGCVADEEEDAGDGGGGERNGEGEVGGGSPSPKTPPARLPGDDYPLTLPGSSRPDCRVGCLARRPHPSARLVLGAH